MSSTQMPLNKRVGHNCQSQPMIARWIFISVDIKGGFTRCNGFACNVRRRRIRRDCILEASCGHYTRRDSAQLELIEERPK